MMTKPKETKAPETDEYLAAMEILKRDKDKIMQEVAILSFKIKSMTQKKN